MLSRLDWSASPNIKESSVSVINNDDTLLSAEPTVNDAAILLDNMSSQQTLELLSSLLQNKKHLLKRIMDEENSDVSPKRSRNNTSEEITSPFIDMTLSGTLSSTSAPTDSNTTDGKLHLSYFREILKQETRQ